MNQSLKFTKQILASIVVAFQVAVLSFVPVVTSVSPAYSQAALLPNAKQQFLDQNGNPASNGRVYMYVPNTTTPKTTWQDSNQTIQNTNPVQLDAGGYATIYGQGSYQQRVVKSDNTQLWNAPTTAWNSAAPSGATGTDTAPVGSVLEWSGFTVPTNWAWANGQAVSRTTYSELLSATTISSSAISCTSGSTTLGGWTDTSQIKVGAPVEATCLPTGTTVVSIGTANTITVSNSANATATVTARVFNFGNGDGVNTFNVIDKRGRKGTGPDCLGGSTCAYRLQVATTISTTIGSLTATVASASGISLGMVVVTTNIPAGSVVTALTGTTVGFNNAATATAGGTAVTFQSTPGVNAPGAVGGAANVPIAQSNLPAASIGVNIPAEQGSHTHPTPDGSQFQIGSAGTSWTAGNGHGASDTTGPAVLPAMSGATAPLGNATALAVLDPYVTVNYIVKIKPNTTGAGGVVSINGMFGDVVCDSTLTCAPVGSPAVNTIGCTSATTSQLGCVQPDGTTTTIISGKLTAIGGSATQVTIGATNVGNGTNGRVLYNNAGILGELATTGSGSVVLSLTPIINNLQAVNPVITGSFTATGLVTNSSLADMASTYFKCRKTASTGAPEDCSPAEVNQILNTTGVGVYNVANYGAVGDGQFASDMSCTNGSSIVTSGTPHWASTDVNKYILLENCANGTAPLPATILAVNSSTNITISANAGSTQTNKRVQWGTLNSTAFSNAINDARGKGYVFIPCGTYITSPLNATNWGGGAIIGAGGSYQCVVLTPNDNFNVMVDMTGSPAFRLSNLQIGFYPQIGIGNAGYVVAPSAAVAGIDNLYITNVFVQGFFTAAACYRDRIASSHFISNHCWNYNQSGTSAAVTFTNSNVNNVQSSFTTTNTNVTTMSCSNLIMTKEEAHGIKDSAGASANYAIRINGCIILDWSGGNIDSANASAIEVTDGHGTTSDYLTMLGPQIYSENGTNPTNIFGGAGSAMSHVYLVNPWTVTSVTCANTGGTGGCTRGSILP